MSHACRYGASQASSSRSGPGRSRQPPLLGRAHLDQPGLAQHPQVLGHGGLAHGQRGHQFAHRALPVTDQVRIRRRRGSASTSNTVVTREACFRHITVKAYKDSARG